MNLYATRLLGAESADWSCTGCDPDGMDMQAGAATLRLDFPERVTSGSGIAQDAGAAGGRGAGQGLTSAYDGYVGCRRADAVCHQMRQTCCYSSASSSNAYPASPVALMVRRAPIDVATTPTGESKTAPRCSK